MSDTEIIDSATHHKEPKTTSGILLSALDMEDEIAHSIYRDYMDRKNWPAGITEDVFDEIRKNLTILLNDTQKHRNIIRALQSKLDTSHG
jgi:hypothetical protein